MMKARNALIEQRKRDNNQERKIAESTKSSITTAPKPIENFKVVPKSKVCIKKLSPKMSVELSKAEKERLLEEKMKVFSISNLQQRFKIKIKVDLKRKGISTFYFMNSLF